MRATHIALLNLLMEMLILSKNAFAETHGVIFDHVHGPVKSTIQSTITGVLDLVPGTWDYADTMGLRTLRCGSCSG